MIMCYIINHNGARLSSEYTRYFTCLTVIQKCPGWLGFPRCTAFRPASPPLGPRLSAVQLGKQTGEETKRAAAAAPCWLWPPSGRFYIVYSNFCKTKKIISCFLLTFNTLISGFWHFLTRKPGKDWLLLASLETLDFFSSHSNPGEDTRQDNNSTFFF